MYWISSPVDIFTGAHELVQYLLVFVFAAIPWIEIAVVIPLALGLGLHPVGVAGLAFVGNLGSVLLLLRFSSLIPRIRTRTAAEWKNETRRSKWGWRIWDRYGLPGLAVAAPMVTGVHLAAMLALVVDTGERDIAKWMAISIGCWTIILVAMTLSGMSIFGFR